jgi:hypothetical protein
MLEALVVAALAVALLIWLILRRPEESSGNASYDFSDGERQPHKWGYTDTVFEFDGPRSVRVTGSRYPLAGYSMPFFIPFAGRYRLHRETTLPSPRCLPSNSTRRRSRQATPIGSCIATDN